MKELLRRSFFGLLYVMTVVFALQYFESKAVLLLVFMIIGLKEFSSLIQLHFNTALLPSVFIFIFSYLKFSPVVIHDYILSISAGFVLISLFIPLIYFIFDKISYQMIPKVYLAVFYLAVPFSLALGIPENLLLAVFIIIWASDTFAYLTGKYLGKHKLAEKISPKKTIEGFAGGVAGSLLLAYIIYTYTTWIEDFGIMEFMFLALLIVVFGTLGDLLESRFKRLAGVKDSGNLIPGHGGILDRLDSFILAVPFVFAYLLIV